MFSYYESEVVGFDSQWHREFETQENSCQTTDYALLDEGTSVRECCDISVQVGENIGVTNVAMNSDASISLENAIPILFEELKFTVPNSVFDRSGACDDYGNKSMKTTYIQTLEEKHEENPETTNNKEMSSHTEVLASKYDSMPVIQLAWSSSGNTLAVARGLFYHENWCQHLGLVNLYSKKSNDDKLKYLHNIKISCCASSISFHPSEPSILSVATFSGEILVYDFQYLQASTYKDILIASDLYEHRGRKISTIQWLTNNQVEKYFSKVVKNFTEKLLISGDCDGKIIVWTVDIVTSVIIKKIWCEIKSHMQDSFKQIFDITCIGFINCWNVSAFNYNSEKHIEDKRDNFDDLFIVGSRTGELSICRSFYDSYKSPCIGSLESHHSCILSIKFSSTKQNILLTLGSDQELKVFNLYMDSPIHILYLQQEYSSADWVPASDSLVLLTPASLKGKGILPFQVFCIDTKNEIPLEASMNILDTNNDAGITTMAINGNMITKLAIGDMKGQVKIWSAVLKETDALVPDL